MASLALGSPCGRPNRLRRFIERALLSVGSSNWKRRAAFGRSAVLKSVARPERFELPTTWFEARRDRKVGKFDVWKSLIFNNHARGMSVANPPESTTKHHRITQKSRNHLVFLKPGGRDFEAPCAANVKRRQQRHCDPTLCKPSAPIVRCSARFHDNSTYFSIIEIAMHLRSTQALAFNYGAFRVRNR
jgi:hypothetical protein